MGARASRSNKGFSLISVVAAGAKLNRMDPRTTVLFSLPLLLAACVIPIPTPEWGDEPISREQFETIENGTGVLSRDDIEALLGEPQQRYADGRVVVYAWTMSQGIWIVGVPAGFGGYGNVGSGESEHRLCLLFDEAGLLEDTRHIDSALFMADSMTANLLEDWLGMAAAARAAPGYARPIDVDEFAMPPHDGPVVSIMLSAESERQPSCWKELEEFDVQGFRLFKHEELRDSFYPWLEPPWYDNLETLASADELDEARRTTGLRFIVVVSNQGNQFARHLCDARNPYAVSCYEIRYRDELGRVALLDLRQAADSPSAGQPAIRISRIPVFPLNRRQACESLMAYAADDIAGLVSGTTSAGPDRE